MQKLVDTHHFIAGLGMYFPLLGCRDLLLEVN
jgi:hypothetical protein